jgi:hypothetical protein
MNEMLTAGLDERTETPRYGRQSRYMPWLNEGEDQPFEDEPLREQSDDSENRQAPSRWRRVLSATLQSLAWWLSRSQVPVGTALGVAAASGLVAYVGSPLLVTGARVIGSVVSLLSLTETTRSGVASLGRVLTP